MPGTAYGRCQERIERICASGGDSRTLRVHLLGELRRVVGFDAYSWLLTDPETCVGTSPLADVPHIADVPRLIRLKYQTDVNRWTGLADPPVALLHEATGAAPFRSLLWRELLSGYGIGDVASMVFRDRYGCWSFLELWRSGSDARFTSAEAGFLTDIVPVVTQALRRTKAETFVVGGRDARRVGPVVLLLSAGLEVLAQTPDTEGYLRVIVPPEEGNAPPNEPLLRLWVRGLPGDLTLSPKAKSVRVDA